MRVIVLGSGVIGVASAYYLAEAGHEVVTKGAARAPFPAQTQALKHCLANIIDNACKYGGKAQIMVQDDERKMVIKVRDFGHGVPESELEKVFEL